ncbi:MAG: hypothetical protein HQL36_06885 [Alphaproteobacteria bacterium]|nr:hypothetical protein [Alphaproteobacteria bacterium]MBF0249466.1 hypothetical protein [Alphaproteobacteria bacterium]
MTATMVSHVDANVATGTTAKRRFSLRRMLAIRKATRSAMIYGLMSAALYYGLYHFNGDIRHMGEMTNQGDRTYFLVPIGLAFLFSIVHGLFTDRFWEALGLKAKR